MERSIWSGLSVLHLVFLGVVLVIPAQAETTSQLNQRLGACGVLTDKAKRAQCFEALARDAIGEVEARETTGKTVARAEEKPRPASSKYADFVVKAKANLTRNFKDSSSAQWRNLFVSDSPKELLTLCGEVNSKNSYGAYVGFRRFFATEDAHLSQVADAKDSTVVDTMWQTLCASRTEEVN